MDLQVNGTRAFAATDGRAFDHTVWKLQARYFAWHGGSVLAVDLPGHGRSEGPPQPTISAMVDWLAALMDAAGVGEAALVGHSMGALVALEAAARHAARVRKLTLFAAADHQALELLTGWGYGRRAHYGGHRMPGIWMCGGGLRTLEQAAPDGYEGGEAAAAGLSCPALVVIGERDLMTPAKRGAALAGLMAHTTTVVIPKAGHIMLDEALDETLDALRGFLAGAP